MTELTETERGLVEAAGKLVAKYLDRFAVNPNLDFDLFVRSAPSAQAGVIAGFVVGEMLKELHQLGFTPAQVRELVHKGE